MVQREMRCGGLLRVSQWEIFLPVVSLLFAGSMTTKFLTSSQPLCCRFHNVLIGNAGSSKLKKKQLNVLINGKDDSQRKKREFNKLTNREVDSALIYNSGVFIQGKILLYCCKIYVSQVFNISEIWASLDNPDLKWAMSQPSQRDQWHEAP